MSLATPRTDVFLSHNSSDKLVVEELAHRLVRRGIQPWLDKWNLVPGAPWQEAIEKALKHCASCAVCIGPSGTGPWQNAEMRAAINHRIRSGENGFRVIPVLLPGAERGDRSSLPTFLVETTWVEFRRTLDDEQALHRLVCGIQGKEPGPGPGAATAEGACPYRGLEAFDVADALFFFGREALKGWLLDRLRPSRQGSRFLAIVGPSGSGKSSLARAGLIASLKNGDLDGSRTWPIAICQPGPQPLESLALALADMAGLQGNPSGLRNLIHDLGQDYSMVHLTTRLALRGTSPDQQAVLLVDQFEELFTLCTEEPARRALIGNLLHAAAAADGRTTVLLTLRSDFYGRCAAYQELAATLSERQELVGPMNEQELRRAIEQPAYRAGCELESELVELLLEDVESQPGCLPLLQHGLLQLWQRREGGRRLTLAAYREIGGIDGALEKHAEEVFERFSERERETCRRIFLRLTQPGVATEDTRRRAFLDELVPASATDSERSAIETVARVLADERLVTTDTAEGAGQEKRPFLDLAHEMLIRGWSRLRRWIEQDRETLLLRRRLDEALAEWETNGRDASYLYRGARLAQAAEWVERQPGELNRAEWEFLQMSIALRDEEQRRELLQEQALREEQQRRAEAEHRRAEERALAARKLKRRAWALALLLVVSLIATTLAWKGKLESDRSRRLSVARGLPGQAQAVRETYPARSLLLAIEALKLSELGDKTRPPDAETTLRDLLSETGGEPLGRNGIETLAISPNRSRLATAGPNQQIYLWDLTAENPELAPVVLHSPEGRAFALSLSSDSRWLAALLGDSIYLWSLKKGNASAVPLALPEEDWLINVGVFSPDGRWLITRRGRKETILRNLISPDELGPALRVPYPSEALAFDSSGSWLAISSGQTIELWNLQAEDPTATRIKVSTDLPDTRALSFSADGQWLIGASRNAEHIRAWNLGARHELSASPLALRGCKGATQSLAVSPDSRWLVAVSNTPLYMNCAWSLSPLNITAKLIREGTIFQSDPDRGSLMIADGTMSHIQCDGYEHDEGIPNVAAFSHSGRWFATITGISPPRLWDCALADSGYLHAQSSFSLRGHEAPVRFLAFSAGDRWLITQGGADAPRLWNLRRSEALSTREPLTFDLRLGSFDLLAFSANGLNLQKSSLAQRAQLNSFASQNPGYGAIAITSTYILPQGIGESILSSDRRWLVIRDPGKADLLWQIVGERPLSQPLRLRSLGSRITSLAVSPDNRWLLTGHADGRCLLQDLKNQGQINLVPTRHSKEIEAVSFSHDGRHIATAGFDGIVRLWKTNGKNISGPPWVLPHQSYGVTATAFSPNGRWLATGGADGRVLIWDRQQPQVKKPHAELRGRGLISTASFSPDSRWLAIGGVTHRESFEPVWLWSFSAKGPAPEPILLDGYIFGVKDLAFSLDSHWLFTTDGFSVVNRWNLDIDEIIDTACQTAGRNLTKEEWETYLEAEPCRRTCQSLPDECSGHP